MNHTVVDSSAWLWHSALFFFRLFVCLFCLFSYLSHFIDDSTSDVVDALGWFQFLTHWDNVNMVIYFGLGSCMTLAAIRNPARSTMPLASSKLGCFVHFMFELTGTTSWFVSILYWAALYPVDDNPPRDYWAFVNVVMHGLPALFMLMEVFLGMGVQVQFHLSIVYAYFITYLFVNAGITVGANHVVYSIMTYKTSATAMWMAISLALIGLCWFLNYLCIRFRARCCTRNRAKSVVVFSKDKPVPTGV